jgi:PAS domain S-box-containing protein
MPLAHAVVRNSRDVPLSCQQAERDLVAARQALRQQSEWLRITLASISDAVLAADADGRVTMMNAVAESVTGWPQAEAVGRPVSDVYHVVDAQTREAVETPAARALKDGVVLGPANPRVLIARDGTEKQITDRAAPMRDEAGTPLGAVIVFSDLTERRQADLARGRIAETLGLALAAADLGTWEWDPATDQVTLSDRAAEIYGVEPGQLYRREWMRGLLHPDYREPTRQAAERAVADRVDYDFEYPLDGPTDKTRWVSARGRGVFDSGGALIRMLGVAQDVTGRKEAELALRASEARHRFLARLASATQALTGPEELMSTTARELADHLGADRCAYAEIENESLIVINGEYCRDVPSILGRWPLAAFGAECGRLMLANQPFVVEDVEAEPRLGPADLAAYRATTVRAMICVPLHKDGKFTAAMAVHQNVARQWTVAEVELVSAVVGRCWEAIERARVARTLHESEARFRRLASAGIIGVIWWDLDRGLILDANDEFLRMIGHDRADLESERLDFGALTPPEWSARNEAGISELRETGVGGAYETEYFRKDGSRVPVIIVGVRFEGATAEGMSFVLDITDRKRMEEELAASRDQLEIILRGVGDGITVQDQSGRILFANDGAARLSGFSSPAPLLTTPLEELMKRLDVCDESGQPFAPAELPAQRALAGEQSPEAVVKFRLGTGEERWSLVRATPVRDPHGCVKLAVNIFHDITQRKRAEETQQFLAEVGVALAGSLDYTTTLASVARLCVPRLADWCTLDVMEEGGTLKRLAVAHRDPERVQWAHEIHRRYPSDPDAPRGLYQVIRTGQAELFAEITDDQLVAAARDPDHLRILRELGMTSVIFVPLRARGRTLGALSLISAESRRRFGPADLELAEEVGRRAGLAADNARLYGAVVATDRRKDEFIALLAHELRNPLAPLRNGLQVMRLAADDANMVAQARAMMDRQLEHMVRLIDDLLDVSRINQNKMDLRRSRVSLADVFSSAVETARPAIETAGHELTVSLPRQALYLDADLTRLAQVFSNLLTNSAKYTERGGSIWLSAEQRGGDVVVSVRDTGIGIPLDALDTIFDMFSQVDRSIERSTGGLGIGLALVKGLVEMHGGRVTAASAGQGKGSTFTVTLPLFEVQADASPTAPIADGPGGQGPRRRILVVDDNRDAADSLAVMLRLMENDVRTVYDGFAAVETAERFRPEIILMDVGMTRLSGLDATRQIRAQPWGHAMVIIALTGWGQENDRERSRAAGCDGHLVKPVSFADLKTLLTDKPRNAK